MLISFEETPIWQCKWSTIFLQDVRKEWLLGEFFVLNYIIVQWSPSFKATPKHRKGGHILKEGGVYWRGSGINVLQCVLKKVAIMQEWEGPYEKNVTNV